MCDTFQTANNKSESELLAALKRAEKVHQEGGGVRKQPKYHLKETALMRMRQQQRFLYRWHFFVIVTISCSYMWSQYVATVIYNMRFLFSLSYALIFNGRLTPLSNPLLFPG